MDIMPSVVRNTENGKDIISVEVSTASIPVLFDGRYFQRSGSTTLELNGNELANFLLRKYGKTWDSLPSEAGLDNIDADAVNVFKDLAKKRVLDIFS